MYKKNQEIKEIFTKAFQYHKINNFKKAENLYKKILKIEPSHFETIFYLATLLAQTKQFNLAKKLFKKATQIKPSYAAAHNNLGAALKELGEYQEAMKSCRIAIQIQPQYAEAYSNLGAILKEQGQYQGAINYCEKAIQIQPKLTSSYKNLGIILNELGEIKKAIDCYKKLNQIQPNSGNIHQNLGKLYVILGNIKKAIDCYRESLKYQPENLFVYFQLSNLNKEILNINLKNMINKILKENTSPIKNIAYGHFLLSKYEFNEKNYENEFNSLIKGHKYYYKAEEKNFKKEIDFRLNILPKSKALFEIDKNNKNNKNILKPIFIVGIPRCGSTLVEKIIASNNQNIPIGEETGILPDFFNRKIIKGQTLLGEIENIKMQLYEKYEEKKLIQQKANYVFTDKTLDNFFYVGLIKQIFPYAKVIDCRRSAISSIVSIYKTILPGVAWAHNLEHIFKYLDNYYKTIRNFNKILPNYIYDLKFENLVNNPENETKKLAQFCGLKWNIKCLEFYKRKDLISKTSSNVQIRKGIYGRYEQKYLAYKKFLYKYGEKYHWFN